MDTQTNRLGLLLFAVAILQPLCGAFTPLTGIGTPIGAASRMLGGPEQPLPVFFSIWGAIFLAMLIFALLMIRRTEPWMSGVARPLLLAGVSNCVWMLIAQLTPSVIAEHVLLLPILISAFASARAFDLMRGLGGSAPKLAADAASGLLSGWLVAAFAISTPLSARVILGLGSTDRVWLMLWLALGVAALGAFAFTRFVSRSLWFFVALLWGLIGIVLNSWQVHETHLLAIITGVIAFTLISLRLSRGARGSHRRLS